MTAGWDGVICSWSDSQWMDKLYLNLSLFWLQNLYSVCPSLIPTGNRAKACQVHPEGIAGKSTRRHQATDYFHTPLTSGWNKTKQNRTPKTKTKPNNSQWLLTDRILIPSIMPPGNIVKLASLSWCPEPFKVACFFPSPWGGAFCHVLHHHSHLVILLWWQVKALCFGDLLLLNKEQGLRAMKLRLETGTRKDLKDRLTSLKSHLWRGSRTFKRSYCYLKRNDKISGARMIRSPVWDSAEVLFLLRYQPICTKPSFSQGTMCMCVLLTETVTRGHNPLKPFLWIDEVTDPDTAVLVFPISTLPYTTINSANKSGSPGSLHSLTPVIVQWEHKIMKISSTY